MAIDWNFTKYQACSWSYLKEIYNRLLEVKMEILQIIIGIAILYYILFLVSKKASKSALIEYDEHKKMPSEQRRLQELKDLDIISDEDYEAASKYYMDIHKNDDQAKKIEAYKIILHDLEVNKILKDDKYQSKMRGLEDRFETNKPSK